MTTRQPKSNFLSVIIVICVTAQGLGAATQPDEEAELVRSIVASAERGDAAKTVAELNALGERLQPGDPVTFVSRMAAALCGIASPVVRYQPEFGPALERWGIAVVSAPLAGEVEPYVLEQQLQVAFQLVWAVWARRPKMEAGRREPPKVIAPMLRVWCNVLAQRKVHAKYESAQPTTIPEELVRKFRGTVTFGMVPDGITDPDLRAAYERYLTSQAEIASGRGRYLRYGRLVERFRQPVDEVLKATCSESDEGRRIGAKVIDECVADPEEKARLLGLLNVATTLPDGR